MRESIPHVIWSVALAVSAFLVALWIVRPISRYETAWLVGALVVFVIGLIVEHRRSQIRARAQQPPFAK